MPLHLLGKKSWNVYNNVNIEKVKRDEAAAAAREEAAEQLMQEQDAARRTAILRGETPPSLPAGPDGSKRTRDRHRDEGTGDRKRQRRLRGEDETDMEMRLAREDAETASTTRTTLSSASKSVDAPVTDHAGHIQLFPAPDERAIRGSAKNAEAEREKAKKKKEYEDQFTMRFSNAAGFKQGLEKPWYANNEGTEGELVRMETNGKDAWGNEDPRRKEREQVRTSQSDPMAFMQKAQSQLKQSEIDRKKWQSQRDREVQDLRNQERQRRKAKHRRREKSPDSLDGFDLDAPDEKRRSHSSRRKESRHGRRRSRSLSPRRRHGTHHGPRTRVDSYDQDVNKN